MDERPMTPAEERKEREEIRRAARVFKAACERRTADDACATCPVYEFCRVEPYAWEV